MAEGCFPWAILSSVMEPVNVDSERKAPVVTLHRPKMPCGRKELGDVLQFRALLFLLFDAILDFPFVLDMYVAMVLLDRNLTRGLGKHASLTSLSIQPV